MTEPDQPDAAAEQGLIVTVDPAADMDAVLWKIREAGVQVDERLDAIHVVRGHGGAEAVSAVRELAEVVSVDRDSIVRLDPREIPDMGPDFESRAREMEPKVTSSSWRSPNWED